MSAVDLHLLAMLVAFLLALVASRSTGMTVGVMVMVTAAWWHEPAVVCAGALWTYMTTPDNPEGPHGGRPRNA